MFHMMTVLSMSLPLAMLALRLAHVAERQKTFATAIDAFHHLHRPHHQR